MMDAANESIQSCLETLDVLSSLFCLEGELTLDDETVDEVHRLRNALDSNRGSDSVSFEALRFTIRVSASDVDGNGLYKDACIALRVLLRRAAPVDITLGQPAWMARKHFQQLSEQLDGIVKAGAGPDSAPDATATVLEAVEFVREHGTTAYADASHSRNAQEEASPAMLDSDTYSNPTGSLVRIWMHLPSLSSKDKRRDLVTHASSYGITGIVSSGKPGLLILEAASVGRVEAYMSYIKTRSWADIPPGHKKVSEKLREEGLRDPEDRVFPDMQEITEIVNVDGMKGVRGNRGDLGLLRAWLEQRGLGGDRLGKILGTSLSAP